MSAQIHVDDVGTVFKATIKDEDGAIVNVSTASTKEMVFHKPDGTPVVKTAVFATDGTDGVIKYVTVTDDTDQDGDWQVQGYVVIGTAIFHSDIHVFKVFPNLSRP